MDEDTLRREVATCCRLAATLGMIDYSGHISARIPGTDTILINSLLESRASITPQDLVKADLNADSMEEGKRLPGEVFIHTSIYRHRKKVNAVAHLHSFAAMALSAGGREYVPVINHGAIFAEGVPIYDDCRHINSLKRGEAIAEMLGHRRALILRGHGAVIAAESIKAVLAASVHFEENARNLLEAYRIGKPRILRAEEISESMLSWKPQRFEKVWSFCLDQANLQNIA